MKKVLRLIFSLSLLGSLAISQLPSSAYCQMMFGSAMATTCSMPCCHAKMPISHCPMIKTAVPHDLIASTLISFKISLQPVHTLGAQALATSQGLITKVAEIIHAIQYFCSGPVQSVRAPPSDIHLENA